MYDYSCSTECVCGNKHELLYSHVPLTHHSPTQPCLNAHIQRNMLLLIHVCVTVTHIMVLTDSEITLSVLAAFIYLSPSGFIMVLIWHWFIQKKKRLSVLRNTALCLWFLFYTFLCRTDTVHTPTLLCDKNVTTKIDLVDLIEHSVYI